MSERGVEAPHGRESIETALAAIKKELALKQIQIYSNTEYDWTSLAAQLPAIKNAIARAIKDDPKNKDHSFLINRGNDPSRISLNDFGFRFIQINPNDTEAQIVTLISTETLRADLNRKLRDLARELDVESIILWSDHVYDYQAIINQIPRLKSLITSLPAATREKLKTQAIVFHSDPTKPCEVVPSTTGKKLIAIPTSLTDSLLPQLQTACDAGELQSKAEKTIEQAFSPIKGGFYRNHNYPADFYRKVIQKEGDIATAARLLSIPIRLSLKKEEIWIIARPGDSVFGDNVITIDPTTQTPSQMAASIERNAATIDKSRVKFSDLLGDTIRFEPEDYTIDGYTQNRGIHRYTAENSKGQKCEIEVIPPEAKNVTTASTLANLGDPDLKQPEIIADLTQNGLRIIITKAPPSPKERIDQWSDTALKAGKIVPLADRFEDLIESLELHLHFAAALKTQGLLLNNCKLAMHQPKTGDDAQLLILGLFASAPSDQQKPNLLNLNQEAVITEFFNHFRINDLSADGVPQDAIALLNQLKDASSVEQRNEVFERITSYNLPEAPQRLGDKFRSAAAKVLQRVPKIPPLSNLSKPKKIALGVAGATLAGAAALAALWPEGQQAPADMPPISDTAAPSTTAAEQEAIKKQLKAVSEAVPEI